MGFTKESLWALRREVMLNSLFIADYRNSRHIDPHVAATFLMASWRMWKLGWRM